MRVRVDESRDREHAVRVDRFHLAAEMRHSAPGRQRGDPFALDPDVQALRAIVRRAAENFGAADTVTLHSMRSARGGRKRGLKICSASGIRSRPKALATSSAWRWMRPLSASPKPLACAFGVAMKLISALSRTSSVATLIVGSRWRT